jgi:glucose/arabinose dehydrogenase
MRNVIFPLVLLVSPLAPLPRAPGAPVRDAVRAPACTPGNGGLTLPDGFCAIVVAEGLGPVRQIAVAPDGIVYGALAKGDGGVVALRDRDGDGHADEQRLFGPAGGNDVKLHDGYLYLALPERIVRWRLVPGQLAPDGEPETIVGGLPGDKSHKAKSIAFGEGDVMYVNIGAPTNSCQQRDRVKQSPGLSPCPELETRAGIWQFSATRAGQRHSEGARFATGARNTMALGIRPGTTQLYGATHGRDQLGDNWGFSEAYNAENPGEELLLVERDADFGWPYCYYSTELKSLVLAPEYGGNGKERGRCSGMREPVMAFPAHWAPMALAFSTGSALEGPYADGVFLAFHGSWNRAPLPQEGFRVVFAPFAGGKPTGSYTTFAAGAEGPTWLRASGVARWRSVHFSRQPGHDLEGGAHVVSRPLWFRATHGGHACG